ncbi:MAG: archaeosortase/exosortase family protein [Candidatus Omnitrophota bacterium]
MVNIPFMRKSFKLALMNYKKRGLIFWALALALAIFLYWLGSIYQGIIYRIFAIPASRCAGFFFGATPFFNEKGIIAIPVANSSITVTPECSAYGFFCLITAIFFVFYNKIKWRVPAFGKAAVILCASYIITIVANGFRIISGYKVYVLTSAIFPKTLQNIIHLSIGVTIFLTIILTVYLILEKMEVCDAE